MNVQWMSPAASKAVSTTQEASIARAFQDITNAGRTLSHVKVIKEYITLPQLYDLTFNMPLIYEISDI